MIMPFNVAPLATAAPEMRETDGKMVHTLLRPKKCTFQYLEREQRGLAIRPGTSAPPNGAADAKVTVTVVPAAGGSAAAGGGKAGGAPARGVASQHGRSVLEKVVTLDVDALIDADKDFELLVMPGMGHGAASSEYGRRRTYEFFERALAGD